MSKEVKFKHKTLTTYEYLIKMPTNEEQDYFKCNQCGKFFVNALYLEKHYSNKHPTVNFALDTAKPNKPEQFKTAEA